jgi:hypothetical protein
MITEHDALTGETSQREATAEELKQAKLDAKAHAVIQADKQAKAEAKSALLERMGITAEEAALLLG